MINVLGRMDVCERIQAVPFKNTEQGNELNLPEGKVKEENKTIEPNVTVNNSTSNVTKVNCLMDTVYGPVEVGYSDI